MYTANDIKSIINKMSVKQKVGQLFLLAYPGKNPEIIKPLIDEYGIAGCYISQDNAETFDEAEQISSKLQVMASRTQNGIPLILGVDQEGSWGVLVPESHTGPGNLALGAIPDSARTADMYRIFADEMLSVGYNALLGPCADVNLTPDSPIIGARSFGEDPEKVARCVAYAVQGCTASGAIATLKHFPGHGSTSGDTHREIPRVERSLDELFKTDLLPFIKGVEAGADIVMTSHILYPKIDPENPATLSSVILKDILRTRIGFKGIILSDSMNMGAIRKFYDPAESTLLALKAGVDIVMLSEEHYDHSADYLDKQLASLRKAEEAVKSGKLSVQEVDEKLFRILSLKLNKMQLRTPRLSAQRYSEAERIQNDISDQCVQVLQKSLWPLPKAGTRICINAAPETAYRFLINARGIGPNQKKTAYEYFKETLEKSGENFIYLNHNEALAGNEDQFKRAEAILIVTEDYPLPGEDFPKAEQEKLAQKLAAKYAEKTVIVGLRSPYEIKLYPKNVTYLCAFSSRGCAAKSAAKAILQFPQM